LSSIIAEWKDLQEQYVNQYISEHTGLHKSLNELRDAVLKSDDYLFLQNLAQVDGLSAHYNPATIEWQLKQLLEKVQISQVCQRELSDVQSDLENGWVCTECGYKPGKTLDFKSEKFLKLIQRGIKEYLDHLAGCADDIRDYVADHSDAVALLGLLENPVTEDDKATLSDEPLRTHLAEALVDASAAKIKVDDLLSKLKPHLLGYYRTGQGELEQKFVFAVREELASYGSDKNDKEKPWKVE